VSFYLENWFNVIFHPTKAAKPWVVLDAVLYFPGWYTWLLLFPVWGIKETVRNSFQISKFGAILVFSTQYSFLTRVPAPQGQKQNTKQQKTWKKKK